jgi:GNAT superfamily N-acetyltransferase
MIREARLSDAPELAALTIELGYEATEEQMRERLPYLVESSDHEVFVAADERDRALAWLHVALRRTVELAPYAQIAGLVVGAGHRGGGIGARLVERAEAWARERGAAQMLVHSNVVRERVHQFYLRAGYSVTKTSRVFTKAL